AKGNSGKKRKQPEGSSSAEGSPVRKRHSVYARVKRSQRCGHCHTCRNPQLKRACLTLRAKQEGGDEQDVGKAAPKALGSSSSTPPPPAERQAQAAAAGPPAPAAPAASGSSGAAAKPGAAAYFASNAPQSQTGPGMGTGGNRLQATLARILGPSGGLKDVHQVGALESLLSTETDVAGRRLLLTIILVSPPEVQEAVVKGQTVAHLGDWVASAMGVGAKGAAPPTAPPPAPVTELVLHTVQCLGVLPITVEALRRTGLGRTFAKVAKASPHAPEVAKACKQLVEQWRKLVDTGQSAAGGEPSGKKKEGVPKRGTPEADNSAGNQVPKSTKLHTMGFKPPPAGRGASSKGKLGEAGEGPPHTAKPGNGTPHSIFPHAKPLQQQQQQPSQQQPSPNHHLPSQQQQQQQQQQKQIGAPTTLASAKAGQHSTPAHAEPSAAAAAQATNLTSTPATTTATA
ncbi:hypothetical protein DUNSADRAFT_18282, partial [Dunaliella salina]